MTVCDYGAKASDTMTRSDSVFTVRRVLAQVNPRRSSNRSGGAVRESLAVEVLELRLGVKERR